MHFKLCKVFATQWSLLDVYPVILMLFLLIKDISPFENSVDPDQLASEAS